MFYRELIYQAVIFLVIKPMVLKKSELTLPSKMQNTPFRQGKTFLTRGIVIIGCIRNVIWSSAFSIKSKLFAELLLVMISLLHRFLLSYTSLPFGFCLNNTTLLSFQIRSNVDWDNGTVEDMFDGLWYMLGDGQVLAAYIVEEGEDYDIYTAPILLNGEQTNLRIKKQYHDDGYDNFILGTWDGIDENGQADKTVRKLRQGDVITPVYYTYDENGEYVDDMTGDEYVYDGDTKVYDNFLPSADYLYSFCIEDIFGNSSYTDFVTFNVDDSGAVSFYID